MIRTYDEIIHPQMELQWSGGSSSAANALYRLAPATTAGVWASGTEPIREQLDAIHRNYGCGIWRHGEDTFDAVLSSWNWRAAIDEDQDCDEAVDYFHQENVSDQREDEAGTEEYACLDLELLFGRENGEDNYE